MGSMDVPFMLNCISGPCFSIQNSGMSILVSSFGAEPSTNVA